jgi:branched-chain amino acid transport system permease protein
MTLMRGYRELIAAAALVPVAFLLPRVVGDFRLFQLATVGVYFVAILGLAILTGWSGQISLGHGAFMAIGAYTSAILVFHHQWTDWLTIPVAGAVAGVAGLLMGIPALRLSGLYLALVTFALAVSVPSLIKKWESQTGGSSGLFLNLHTNMWLYRTTWIVAAVLYVGAWLLLRGKFGRALRAVRDSEIAAASSGINLALVKTIAFGISAFYAGVAGSLLGITAAYVNPNSFPVSLSIYLLVGLVVGGFGGLLPLLLGAAFVEYVQVYASKVAPDTPGVATLVFGVALILAVMLVAAIRPALDRWHTVRRQRGPAAVEETG